MITFCGTVIERLLKIGVILTAYMDGRDMRKRPSCGMGHGIEISQDEVRYEPESMDCIRSAVSGNKSVRPTAHPANEGT
jgi:hypothetical protein